MKVTQPLRTSVSSSVKRNEEHPISLGRCDVQTRRRARKSFASRETQNGCGRGRGRDRAAVRSGFGRGGLTGQRGHPLVHEREGVRKPR